MYSHPAFGLLWPLLNRKFLDAALLRLRFCSTFGSALVNPEVLVRHVLRATLATKSASKFGAPPKRLNYGQALSCVQAETGIDRAPSPRPSTPPKGARGNDVRPSRRPSFNSNANSHKCLLATHNRTVFFSTHFTIPYSRLPLFVSVPL